MAHRVEMCIYIQLMLLPVAMCVYSRALQALDEVATWCWAAAHQAAVAAAMSKSVLEGVHAKVTYPEEFSFAVAPPAGLV
jgi:hypothetical protein